MSPTFTASSPGRLDVMGGFADYSGSLVLQMPIAQETKVHVRLRDDYICSITSQLDDHASFKASFDVRLLFHQPDFSWKKAHDFFRNNDLVWAAYVAGCAVLLHELKFIEFKGADFDVQSKVPLGKGVSSSAALEVATMKALAQAFQLKFDGTQLPILAQKVENQIVGAPCGLMDQLASYHGIPNYLLPITCQPDILHKPVQIPSHIKFIGIDSGVRHSVSGASYTDVRCAAFMGYSILAQSLGIRIQEIQIARESGIWNDLPFAGYLCNIHPDEFTHKFQSLLPEKISGKDFIQKFKITTDSITQINPEKEYSILNCTKHPVLENARVQKFKSIVEEINSNKATNSSIDELGQLMYQSHEGYTNCGLQSERTEEIIQLAKQAPNIAGAKITGGGSGGTVCLLANGQTGIDSVKSIHQKLQTKYNTSLVLLL